MAALTPLIALITIKYCCPDKYLYVAYYPPPLLPQPSPHQCLSIPTLPQYPLQDIASTVV